MTVATRPVAGAGALAGVGVLAVVVAVRASGVAEPPPTAFEAFDPGALTRWGLPLVRFTSTGAAVLCIGTLIGGLVLRGATERVLRRWSSALAVTVVTAQLAQVALGVSAAVGRPVLDVPPQEFVACLSLTSIVYCLVGTAGAAAVALLAASRVPVERVLLLALGATAAPFMGGHAGNEPDHLVTQALIVVHVLAASVWVGGLGLLLVLGVALRDLAAVRAMAPVVSRLALWCAAATVLSGLASAVVRLPDDGYPAPYLALLGVKAVLFVVLCGFGLAHRRDDLAAAGRTFTRRAYAELAVMVAVVSVATVLSQLSPQGAA